LLRMGRQLTRTGACITITAIISLSHLSNVDVVDVVVVVVVVHVVLIALHVRTAFASGGASTHMDRCVHY
jgi:hypothetical protein